MFEYPLLHKKFKNMVHNKTKSKLTIAVTMLNFVTNINKIPIKYSQK